MHGCLFDNGYLNVLYGMRCHLILVVTAVVIQQLFNVAIIAELFQFITGSTIS